MKKLRVGVDARMSVGSYRGMGRFARELVSQCEEDVLWLGHAGQRADPLVNYASGTSFYPFWEQLHLPRLCRDLHLDVLLCPYNTAPVFRVAPTKLIVVVHDLIYLEPMRSNPFSSSLYQIAGRIYRRAIVPAALAQADAVVTVSSYSSRELVRRSRVGIRPLLVVPNTVDERWYTPAPDGRRKGGFILTVSGDAPHKNLHRVIEAFACVRARGEIPSTVRLCIAGVSRRGATSIMRAVTQRGLADVTDVLPYIDESEMQRLYATAAVMVFPSLFEGFGIPVLEAMACGCPVIASDRGALPEVAGDAALIVDPLSVEEIASAISRVLRDPELAQELTMKGQINAERFHPHVIRPQMRQVWSTVRSLCC